MMTKRFLLVPETIHGHVVLEYTGRYRTSPYTLEQEQLLTAKELKNLLMPREIYRQLIPVRVSITDTIYSFGKHFLFI